MIFTLSDRENLTRKQVISREIEHHHGKPLRRFHLARQENEPGGCVLADASRPRQVA